MKRLYRAFRIVLLALAGLALIPLVLSVAYNWVNPPLTVPIAWEIVTGRQPARDWVALSEVSDPMIAGVVMSEDARFCRHNGVDWASLQTQVEAARAGGRVRGASTISMQTVKNLFLWQSRSYVRKAIEIPLALWLELTMDKRRILEIYLNIAEFGPSIYGVEAAAGKIYKKDASQLSRAEAARLATVLPNPKARNPRRPSRYHARLARTIERRIRAAGSWLDCLDATPKK